MTKLQSAIPDWATSAAIRINNRYELGVTDTELLQMARMIYRESARAMSPPERRQVDAEVEITPQMIEAGAYVLCERHRVTGRLLAEGLAAEVFEAIAKATESQS